MTLPIQRNNTMSTKKVATKAKERAVIVTTQNRGVFFGYVTDSARNAWEAQPDASAVRIADSRLCVYWSPDVKGFMGLAANGPTSKCRVGPAANITVRNVTAILDVSEKAEAAWKAEPWGS